MESRTLAESRPLEALRRAHRVTLEKVELLERALRTPGPGKESAEPQQGVKEILSSLGPELVRHFSDEEEVLFPCLASVIGSRGPIAAMGDEHKVIQRSLALLREKGEEASSGSPPSSPTLEEVVNYLVVFLRSHIKKEDSMLFPLAEKVLQRSMLEEIVAEIEAAGEGQGASQGDYAWR